MSNETAAPATSAARLVAFREMVAATGGRVVKSLRTRPGRTALHLSLTDDEVLALMFAIKASPIAVAFTLADSDNNRYHVQIG